MFRKSKVKIVIAIMSILFLLLIGIFCTIYISSYVQMMNENRKMLEEYASSYMLLDSPEIDVTNVGRPKYNINNPKIELPRFEVTTFYSVAVSKNGEVLNADNAEVSTYSEEELSELALKIINSKNKSGTMGDLIYQTADKGEYILVAFLDNTVVMESAKTLLTNTMLFGGAALVFLFFFARHLANRIISPLEESYQKQKQFISDAGHELKTPVTVINVNAELLSREVGENQWISNIQYENERMSVLITQLLDLAKTENVTPQMEHIDLSRLVFSEMLPMESVAFENRLVLNTDIQDNIFVFGNNTQLKQLTSILLDNAIKHGIGGKEVWISLKKERSNAVLSVINNGEEIPEEQRTHLFERFYRVDTARNSDDKHYGLGLAIAKAIAVTHKGTISVQCYDGKVAFTAKIPLQK